VEPFDHVIDSRLRSSATHSLAFSIARVEEVGGGVRGVVSSVVAYIEDLSIDGEPLEVALSCGPRWLVLDLPARIRM
jgi:hypothetical protein